MRRPISRRAAPALRSGPGAASASCGARTPGPPAAAYATALIVAPIFSMISSIWFSLMISGGVSSIVSPAMRTITPSSKNA